MENTQRTADFIDRMRLRSNELTDGLATIFADPVSSAGFVWEVGCGHGHFLTAYATAHPERLCVGIDIASDRVERAVRKQTRAGLTNLHFIRADARLFLEVMPAHARVGQAFILFPDPWPKARHHKHRVLQPAFLTALAERSAAGARLYFRTDYAPYFEDAAKTIAGHARWQIHDPVWPFEFETVFQSRAESYQSLIATATGHA